MRLLVLLTIFFPLTRAGGEEFDWEDYATVVRSSEDRSPPEHALEGRVRRCTWTWIELEPENGRRVWSLREDNCHLVDMDSDE